MHIDRIVLVTKRTALEELIARHGSVGQAAFFLKSRGEDIDEYRAAHDAHAAALLLLEQSLPRKIARTHLMREWIANFLFRPKDLMIVAGPDGLFVNLAKYLQDQPVIAVNPDPARIDGVIMQHRPDQVGQLVEGIVKDSAAISEITLAEAQTNDGQSLLAVNDFLIGRRDQVSARYCIDWNGKRERQSSSGVLVSTGLGRTGWLKSVFATASGLVGWSVQRVLPGPTERALFFVVREPFVSGYTSATIVCDRIEAHDRLVVISEMPEGGVVFSDGSPDHAIDLPAGTSLTVGVAKRCVRLVAVEAANT